MISPSSILLAFFLTSLTLYLLRREIFFNNLSDDMISQLYALTGSVHQILTEHNIRYFIIGGTLLGSCRNGKFIPWDDDADIGIFEEDFSRFLQIDFNQYGLKQCGLALNNMGKITHLSSYNSHQKGKGVFVDVFLFRRVPDMNGQTRVEYSNELYRQMWPKEYFYEHELSPLSHDYSFGPNLLCGPQKDVREIICERAWSFTWREVPLDLFSYWRWYLPCFSAICTVSILILWFIIIDKFRKTF